MAPSAGPTLFTTNEALGPLAQSGPTFFGTPIFPPNGGFAPSDDFSPATLLAFAEAGRKRRASEAAARTPVAPVVPTAHAAPVAPPPPGVPVPPAQAASAAQQAIAQQNNALVATLAQQIIARNKAAKTSSLPPMPTARTPGEIKTTVGDTPVKTPTPAGKSAALGELIPTADGPFLTPIGPRSWKLPNSDPRNRKPATTIQRILRSIDFAFEKATGGVGRIVRQTGKGVGEAFEGKIGIGPETWRALVKAGIFRSNNTDLMSGVQAFNEVLFEGGAIAGGLALRTLRAVENAGVEAVVQFAREAGETETGARKLKRDLRGLALIAGIVSGTNPKGLSRGRGRRSSGIGRKKALARTPGPARRDDFVSGEEWGAYQTRISSGVPLGFKSKGEVNTFVGQLKSTISEHGTTRIAIRGSAVTNRKFDRRTQKYSSELRFRKDSDYDIAIVNEKMLDKIKNTKLLVGKNRTISLKASQLEGLGFVSLAMLAEKRFGTHPVNIMIYRNEDSVVRRGPMMWLD